MVLKKEKTKNHFFKSLRAKTLICVYFESI